MPVWYNWKIGNIACLRDQSNLWFTAAEFIRWHECQHSGATGQVLMNNKAIRVPSYATYHTTNGTLRIVVELEAKNADRALCGRNPEQCSEHVSSSINGPQVLACLPGLVLDLQWSSTLVSTHSIVVMFQEGAVTGIIICCNALVV